MNLAHQTAKAEVLLTKIEQVNIPRIESEMDYSNASDSVAFINKTVKEIDSVRQTMTKPLVARQKEINNAFRPHISSAKAVLDEIKASMLTFHKKQEREQLLLEQKAMSESQESHLIVEDKVANIKKAQHSSNTKKTTTKYRTKDPTLRDVVTIKQNKMKEWDLEHSSCPEWVETYQESSIVVRRKR